MLVPGHRGFLSVPGCGIVWGRCAESRDAERLALCPAGRSCIGGRRSSGSRWVLMPAGSFWPKHSRTKAVLCGQCGKNAAWDFIVQSHRIAQITLRTCGNIKLQTQSPLIQVNVGFFFHHVSILVACLCFNYILIFMILWKCGRLPCMLFLNPENNHRIEKKIYSSVGCQSITQRRSRAYAAPAKECFVYFPQCCAEQLISWQTDLLFFFFFYLLIKPLVTQNQPGRLLHVCSEGDMFPLRQRFPLLTFAADALRTLTRCRS